MFFNKDPLSNLAPFLERPYPKAHDKDFSPFVGWVIEQYFYCYTSQRRRVIACKAKQANDKFFFYMNCYGFAFDSYWTYAYQIHGESIPTLLEDDFIQTDTPASSDLIAYFNEKNECIHCARVISREDGDELKKITILEKRGMNPLILSVPLSSSIEAYTHNETPPKIKFYREKPPQLTPTVAGLLEIQKRHNQLYFKYLRRGGLKFICYG